MADCITINHGGSQTARYSRGSCRGDACIAALLLHLLLLVHLRFHRLLSLLLFDLVGLCVHLGEKLADQYVGVAILLRLGAGRGR